MKSSLNHERDKHGKRQSKQCYLTSKRRVPSQINPDAMLPSASTKMQFLFRNSVKRLSGRTLSNTSAFIQASKIGFVVGCAALAKYLKVVPGGKMRGLLFGRTSSSLLNWPKRRRKKNLFFGTFRSEKKKHIYFFAGNCVRDATFFTVSWERRDQQGV